MPKKTGTAREFVLQALRQHADRELQVGDLYDLAGQRFSKENLGNLMPKLLAEGLVERTTDGRAAWWAITPAGLAGRKLAAPVPVAATKPPGAPEPVPKPKPEPEPEPEPAPEPEPGPKPEPKPETAAVPEPAQPAAAPASAPTESAAERGLFGYARAWAKRMATQRGNGESPSD